MVWNIFALYFAQIAKIYIMRALLIQVLYARARIDTRMFNNKKKKRNCKKVLLNTIITLLLKRERVLKLHKSIDITWNFFFVRKYCH